jgi:hypothetical protein
VEKFKADFKGDGWTSSSKNAFSRIKTFTEGTIIFKRPSE